MKVDPEPTSEVKTKLALTSGGQLTETQETKEVINNRLLITLTLSNRLYGFYNQAVTKKNNLI
jgi:hypothetical protein